MYDVVNMLPIPKSASVYFRGRVRSRNMMSAISDDRVCSDIGSDSFVKIQQLESDIHSKHRRTS